MIHRIANSIYLVAGPWYVVFCVIIGLSAILSGRPKEGLIGFLFAASNLLIFCL